MEVAGTWIRIKRSYQHRVRCSLSIRIPVQIMRNHIQQKRWSVRSCSRILVGNESCRIERLARRKAKGLRTELQAVDSADEIRDRIAAFCRIVEDEYVRICTAHKYIAARASNQSVIAVAAI